MDEECESDIPDDPDEYSDTLVILLRKACHRGLSKVIMRQLFFRAVSNCQRLAPHFGESTVAAMKAKLELVHEDLVSHQTDMVSASGDFAMMRMMLRAAAAANPPSSRALNPQPGLARNFLRQAEHDVAAAQNDNLGIGEEGERSGQWACFKLHQVNVTVNVVYNILGAQNL